MCVVRLTEALLREPLITDGAEVRLVIAASGQHEQGAGNANHTCRNQHPNHLVHLSTNWRRKFLSHPRRVLC